MRRYKYIMYHLLTKEKLELLFKLSSNFKNPRYFHSIKVIGIKNCGEKPLTISKFVNKMFVLNYCQILLTYKNFLESSTVIV